jgi:hypothetical protein
VGRWSPRPGRGSEVTKGQCSLGAQAGIASLIRPHSSSSSSKHSRSTTLHRSGLLLGPTCALYWQNFASVWKGKTLTGFNRCGESSWVLGNLMVENYSLGVDFFLNNKLGCWC